jgi:hypothetical protein
MYIRNWLVWALALIVWLLLSFNGVHAQAIPDLTWFRVDLLH